MKIVQYGSSKQKAIEKMAIVENKRKSADRDLYADCYCSSLVMLL